MQRLIRSCTLLLLVAGLSACVLVPGRHGRLRVAVALPIPVIHVRIAGPVTAPAPQPHDWHESSHPHREDSALPYPHPAPPPTYPTAGQAPRPALYGTVRSLEAADGGRLQGQVLRVRVEIEPRGTRVFDVPIDTRWRVGDRVRVDGYMLGRD